MDNFSVPANGPDDNAIPVNDDPERREQKGEEEADIVALPPLPETTDAGRGIRLAHRMSSDRSHLYNADEGSWLAWNGAVWCDDHVPASADRLASQLAAGPYWQQIKVKGKKRLVRNAGPDPDALSDASIKRALHRASKNSRLRIDNRVLDQEPTLLATPFGTADLAAGTLRAANPDELLTRCAGYTPEFGAEHPRWSANLRWVTAGDDEQEGYLQRVAGMALVGHVLDHKLIVAKGPSRTGKSTYLQVLSKLLGGQLARTIPASMISARRQLTASEVEYHKVRLRGARLITAYESEEGGILSEATVKTITSGDPITARNPAGRPFEYDPTWTAMLATNFEPEVLSDDDAIWNRIVLVPFEHVRPKDAEHTDRLYVSRLLAAEGPAIMAWAIQGAADYLRDGLGSCAAVEAATAEYRQEQDLVGQFLDDYMVIDPNRECSNDDLRWAWETWNEEQGRRRPWTLRTLKTHLKHRQIVAAGGDGERRTNSTRYVIGLDLNNEMSTRHGHQQVRY